MKLQRFFSVLLSTKYEGCRLEIRSICNSLDTFVTQTVDLLPSCENIEVGKFENDFSKSSIFSLSDSCGKPDSRIGEPTKTRMSNLKAIWCQFKQPFCYDKSSKKIYSCLIYDRGLRLKSTRGAYEMILGPQLEVKKCSADRSLLNSVVKGYTMN